MKKYLIETERLIIKPVNNEDLENIYLLDSDKFVRNYFPEGILDRNKIFSFMEHYIHGWIEFDCGIFSTLMFSIFEIKSNFFIGRAGFSNRNTDDKIEFGYLFLKEFWGKGYATESGKALLNWILRFIDKKRIISFARIDHNESNEVLLKCGMKYFKTEEYANKFWNFYNLKEPNEL